jgi:hypothetical protein
MTLSVMLGSGELLMSQQSDFQCWPQVQISYNASKKIQISLEEEVRLRENATQIKRELTELGMSYRLNKTIRFSLIYRLELNWRNADEKIWRSGMYADIQLREKIQRLQLDYRLRFQSPKIETFTELNNLSVIFVNRHKGSLSYNIKGIPLTPAVAAEVFIPVSKQPPIFAQEYRVWLELSYALNKRNEIGIRYGIEREINVTDPLTAYVLGLTYSYSIN